MTILKPKESETVIEVNKRRKIESSSGPTQTRTTVDNIWAVVPSEFSQRCTNPIRKIVDNIKKPTHGKTLIPLSLGDPTVFGNLKTPDVLVESLVRNCRSFKHNGYVHSAGNEAAREAIANAYSSVGATLTKDDVIIASGCSGAIEIALNGLLNPGDNILLPQPGFPLYEVIAKAHRVECKFYRLLPEKNWEIDLDHLKTLIDDSTKAILVNNPSNPCGSVYNKDHLIQILQICEDYRLPVIADEIYGDMVFDDNVFHPMATLTSSVPVIAVGGLAKQYLIPGWRVGWVLLYDRNDILDPLRQAYFKLSQLILGAGSLTQSIIPDILTPTPADERALSEFKKEYRGTLTKNAAFTLERLQNVPGLQLIVPQGAMYVMVKIDVDRYPDLQDDCEFVQKLLDEEAVFVLPGQCFGMNNYFRLVFSAPMAILSDAYDRIIDFCTRHATA